MSGRLVGEVLDNAPIDLTPRELLVLVAIAEAARDNDRTARYETSCEAIADRTRSTPGSVRNTLQTLRARGLVVPLIDRPSRGTAQQYRLPRLTPDHRRAVLS